MMPQSLPLMPQMPHLLNRRVRDSSMLDKHGQVSMLPLHQPFLAETSRSCAIHTWLYQATQQSQESAFSEKQRREFLFLPFEDRLPMHVAQCIGYIPSKQGY